MTTTNYQKFQFLPPDEVQFKKAIKILLLLTVVSIVLFMPIRLGLSRDTSLISEFGTGLIRAIPPVFGAFSVFHWLNMVERRHKAKFGRIEINDEQLKINSGTANSLVIKFREVEEFKSDNGILEINHRVKGKSKKVLIPLAEIEHSEEFVTTIEEKLVRG